jgi:uncharacterized protein YjbK
MQLIQRNAVVQEAVFKDYFFDSTDFALLKQNNWLKKRVYAPFGQDEKFEWSLKHHLRTERDGVCYEEFQALDRQTLLNNLIPKQDQKTSLFAHFDVRRYQLQLGENTATTGDKIYVEQVQFSHEDYFLIGTLESPSKDHILSALSTLRDQYGITSDASRSKIVEYLHSYRPKLYKMLIELGHVKDIPYKCARSFNRPKLPADGKQLKPDRITSSDLPKYWGKLDEELDRKWFEVK